MRSLSWSQGRGAPARSVAAGRRAPVKRSGPKKGPVKRRPKGAGRASGRRKAQPASRLVRLAWLIRDGIATEWPFASMVGALVALALIYGVFAGGYVGAAGSAVLASGHRMLGAVGFTVQEVTVSGRSRTSPQVIMDELGLERGDLILTFDVAEARAKLERLDWVQSATVTRLLPDTIHVTLIERRPFAIWQRGGRLSVIDREGGVITDGDIAAYGHLPLVVDHGAARHAAALVDTLERQPEFYARVRAAVRVSDRRWNLRLENGVDVRLPEVGAEEALGRLIELDASQRVLSRDIEAVDLRLADRFTIKLSPEAAARREATIGAAAKGKSGGGSET